MVSYLSFGAVTALAATTRQVLARYVGEQAEAPVHAVLAAR